MSHRLPKNLIIMESPIIRKVSSARENTAPNLLNDEAGPLSMDKDIKQLEISSSSDSVSEKSEISSGDAYAWRICLKNVERNDIPAADVQASEPDG